MIDDRKREAFIYGSTIKEILQQIALEIQKVNACPCEYPSFAIKMQRSYIKFKFHAVSNILLLLLY